MFWRPKSVSRAHVRVTWLVIGVAVVTATVIAAAEKVTACGWWGDWYPSYCYAPCCRYLPSDVPAQILVRVPAEARVYFDNEATIQGGEVRLYESPPLPAGSEFCYEVRVEIKSGEDERTETRQLVIAAGQLTQVDFRSPDPKPGELPELREMPTLPEEYFPSQKP